MIPWKPRWRVIITHTRTHALESLRKRKRWFKVSENYFIHIVASLALRVYSWNVPAEFHRLESNLFVIVPYTRVRVVRNLGPRLKCFSLNFDLFLSYGLFLTSRIPASKRHRGSGKEIHKYNTIYIYKWNMYVYKCQSFYFLKFFFFRSDWREMPKRNNAVRFVITPLPTSRRLSFE